MCWSIILTMSERADTILDHSCIFLHCCSLQYLTPIWHAIDWWTLFFNRKKKKKKKRFLTIKWFWVESQPLKTNTLETLILKRASLFIRQGTFKTRQFEMHLGKGRICDFDFFLYLFTSYKSSGYIIMPMQCNICLGTPLSRNNLGTCSIMKRDPTVRQSRQVLYWCIRHSEVLILCLACVLSACSLIFSVNSNITSCWLCFHNPLAIKLTVMHTSCHTHTRTHTHTPYDVLFCLDSLVVFQVVTCSINLPQYWV